MGSRRPGLGTPLTLVAEDGAAANAAAMALGEGQEAAHLAREHCLAPRVLAPCRGRERVGVVQLPQ